jgi:hypothetical protein
VLSEWLVRELESLDSQHLSDEEYYDAACNRYEAVMLRLSEGLGKTSESNAVLVKSLWLEYKHMATEKIKAAFSFAKCKDEQASQLAANLSLRCEMRIREHEEKSQKMKQLIKHYEYEKAEGYEKCNEYRSQYDALSLECQQVRLENTRLQTENAELQETLQAMRTYFSEQKQTQSAGTILIANVFIEAEEAVDQHIRDDLLRIKLRKRRLSKNANLLPPNILLNVSHSPPLSNRRLDMKGTLNKQGEQPQPAARRMTLKSIPSLPLALNTERLEPATPSPERAHVN